MTTGTQCIPIEGLLWWPGRSSSERRRPAAESQEHTHWNPAGVRLPAGECQRRRKPTAAREVLGLAAACLAAVGSSVFVGSSSMGRLAPLAALGPLLSLRRCALTTCCWRCSLCGLEINGRPTWSTPQCSLKQPLKLAKLISIEVRDRPIRDASAVPDQNIVAFERITAGPTLLCVA
jgi:hypothetical protein